MGGAAAGFTEGAGAMFYNPAGLARMEPESRPELSMAYSNLLETTYAGSAAFARPLRVGQTDQVVGAGLIYFSQSPQTSFNGQGDAIGAFTPYDAALNLSYARRIHSLLLGGNVKLIRSAVADTAGMGAALDFGAQYPHVTEIGDGALDLGGSLSNFGTPIRVGAGSSPLPMSFRLGSLWHTATFLNTALDVVVPVDQSPYVSFGVEAVEKQPGWAGALRFGYNQSNSRGVDGFAGLTAGAGLDIARFRIDYAWVPFGDLGTTNRVAMTFRF